MINQRILIQILDNIEYKPMTGFRHGWMGDGFYIQHWQQVPCAEDPEGPPEAPHYGRKWYISKHMCISEIVQTALAAIIMYEEHEVREFFKYKGQRPFGPHVDVDALIDAGQFKDVRDDKSAAKAVSVG